MKTEVALKADLGHAVRSAGDILTTAREADRSLTTEEQAEFDKYNDESRTIQADIDSLMATRARQVVLEEMEGRLKEPEERTSPPITIKDPLQEAREEAGIEPIRWGKTTAYTNDTAGRQKATRVGHWIRAHIFNDEKSRRFCINNGVGEYRALNETINTAGGVLVPSEMFQGIIDLRVAFGRFREHAQNLPMAHDTITIPRTVADMTANHTGEGKAITESTSTFNEVSLTAKKIAIFTRMSTELQEDAFISIADILTTQMARAFALREDTDGFAGTGAAVNGGTVGIQRIFEADNSLAGAIDVNAGAQTFAAVSAAGISQVIAQLPDYAEVNAKFFCSRVGAELMFGRLMAAGGGNTMTDLAGRPQRTYLGYPVITVNVMNKLTTSLDNLVLFLFGDLSLSSTIGDSRGITVKMSEHRYIENDQVAITATERTAIVNHDFGTTTATDTGPIVAGIGVS